MVLTGSRSTPSRPSTFSDADTYAVHFLRNGALIVTMHLGNYRMSLVDDESSVNILYGGALEDGGHLGDSPGNDQSLDPVSPLCLTGTRRVRLTRFHYRFVLIRITSSQSFM